MSGYNANKEHGPHSTSDKAASPKLPVHSLKITAFNYASLGSKCRQPSSQRIPPPNKESYVLLEHYSLACSFQGLQIDSKLVSVNG